MKLNILKLKQRRMFVWVLELTTLIAFIYCFVVFWVPFIQQTIHPTQNVFLVIIFYILYPIAILRLLVNVFITSFNKEKGYLTKKQFAKYISRQVIDDANGFLEHRSELLKKSTGIVTTHVSREIIKFEVNSILLFYVVLEITPKNQRYWISTNNPRYDDISRYKLVPDIPNYTTWEVMCGLYLKTREHFESYTRTEKMYERYQRKQEEEVEQQTKKKEELAKTEILEKKVFKEGEYDE